MVVTKKVTKKVSSFTDAQLKEITLLVQSEVEKHLAKLKITKTN